MTFGPASAQEGERNASQRRHDGIAIALSSMTTMAGLRSGYADRLIVRAADVSLKERRRLVILARETPLNDIQPENMRTLSHMGAIVAPPVPVFDNTPQSVEERVDYTVGRVLDRFGLEMP